MQNALKPGCFKDESASGILMQGVFLRSKMYSLKSEQPELCKVTAKGIDKASKERELNHQKYLDTLFKHNISDPVTSFHIMNQSHKIYTVKQTKEALSNFNDKVYVSKTSDGRFIVRPLGYKEF